MTVFPTWYTDKWSADSTDKVWASDGVTNFNITVDEIGTEVFTDRTTTNLSEWTNEYYTEAKVTANTTVVWKADKINVLELDNTTSFTPDADYEPATKKYVDDSWTNINWITAETTIDDADELIFYDDSASINKKIGIDDFKTSVESDIRSIQPAQTTTYLSSLWNNDTTSTSFVTLKSFTATKSWAYRVEYTWLETANAWTWWITRIEVDGIIYWEFALAANQTDTFLWVVHIISWDTINFQAKQNSSSSNMRINSTTVKWT